MFKEPGIPHTFRSWSGAETVENRTAKRGLKMEIRISLSRIQGLKNGAVPQVLTCCLS
jgi:hypothetical protein